jgi:F420-non-reducing hydrogenase iron-sulfur subunit
MHHESKPAGPKGVTGTDGNGGGPWEPRILAIFCNWCTYTAADLAGVSRMKYSPNVRIVRVMCSGRVDPQFVLDAFARGADGVLIGGCHPGDCHYIEGNYKCLRRMELLKRMLADMGVGPGRFRLEWISAAEGEKVQRVINEMDAQVRALGPLGMPKRFSDWDKEIAELEREMSKGEPAHV